MNLPEETEVIVQVPINFTILDLLVNPTMEGGPCLLIHPLLLSPASWRVSLLTLAGVTTPTACCPSMTLTVVWEGSQRERAGCPPTVCSRGPSAPGLRSGSAPTWADSGVK